MYPNQPQPGQFGGPAMYQPERKGCWGRNWKWIVPTGCLGLIFAGVAIAAGVFFIIISTVKSSEVYQQALEKARSNAEVVAELGEPIKDGWFVSGSVESHGRDGYAKFQIPISGPKNSGTVYVSALKIHDLYQNDDWNYEILEVEVKGRASRISLLDKETTTEPTTPDEKDFGNANDNTNGDEEDEAAPPPPPRPPSSSTIVSGGVLNAKAISKPQPPYPAIAKAARASGNVTVQVTVDEEGNVISATAVNGHPLLQQAAVAAARQAKFSPTTLSGHPVKVTGI